jgi:PAS domain S-box-containing protein
VAERLTGWTLAEAKGRPIAEIFNIINVQDGTTVENPVERVLRDGLSVELANHTVLIARNGEKYQIADSCAPICSEDGKMMGVVLVFRGVTEAYRKREELRSSEEWHRAIFEKNRSVQLMVDPQYGAIMDANPAACSFYGYSRERLLQMKISDINTLPPDVVLQKLAEVLAERANSFIFKHRLADGDLRYQRTGVCIFHRS